MKNQVQKKYELLQNDTVKHLDKILYRIKTVKSFIHVKAGELGGYIEKEENLKESPLNAGFLF